MCGPSAARYGYNVTYFTHLGTIIVAFSVARRITYLCLHLCLRVCARPSPFLPYHGACPWRWRLCCACGDRPACCVPTLSPSLMACREREEGGLLGAFSVGGCVAALCTSFSLSLLGLPILVAFAAAGSGSCSLAIPCLCLLARVGIPYHSYHHHFFPHGLPLRYSLIPRMFRSAVLAASCSSCVLWRCPLFLRRWRLPFALMAHGAREEGGFRGVFSLRWRGGVVPFVFLVHPWPFHPCIVCGGGFGLVLPLDTLLVFASACGHTTCSLCALRWCVAPFSRFRGGALHNIISFRLGCPSGIPSYHSCFVPRCWRPFVLCVFLGGVHIFFGVGGL